MSRLKEYDDLNFISLFREFWDARLFISVGVFVGVLLAFCFTVLAQPKYEARMMVGPAQPLEVSMQARFQDGQNSYVLPSERVKPSETVSHFVRFEAMMRGVSVSRLLLRDDRVLNGLKNDRAFIFDDGRDGVQPTELAKYIARRVELDRFGETPLKEMVYHHEDREFAAYFLQQIHRVADQLIRAELRGKVDERIDYLERVLAKTVNPEQRRIVTNLLLEQERARMTVSMDAPVAAMVVEPAASSVRAVWPDLALVYSSFGLLGFLAGYVLFGLIAYKQQEELLKREVSITPQKPEMRGQDLQHKPKRPLKYGSWFQNRPDNDVSEDINRRHKRDVSDAAE